MRRRLQQAFTLIELVFVIVVIGLVSSLTMPRVSNLLRINLRTAASDLSGYLRNAYDRAVLRHERIRVRFDLEGGRYFAEVYDETLTRIPMLGADTDLDKAISTFEDRLEAPAYTDEELAERENARYRRSEVRSLKDVKLPRGISLKGIHILSSGETLTQGTPFILFAPGGFATEAIIYLTNDKEDVYSVILPPLGGRAIMENTEVRPRDI